MSSINAVSEGDRVGTPYGDGEIVDFMFNNLTATRAYAIVKLDKDAPRTKDLGNNRVLLTGSQIKEIA